MHLEIDEGFCEHPKTLRFAGLMKDPNAPFMVLRLWRWACRSAKDGSLAGMEPIEVEMAAGYRAIDGTCYAALVRAGFVDEVDGKPGRLHNWMKRTGAAIARMEAEADRKRWARAHNRKPSMCGGAAAGCPMCRSAASLDDDDMELAASAGRPPDGHEIGEGRPDTDQTSPVQSSPDQEERESPSRDHGASAPRHSEPRLTCDTLLRLFGGIRSEVTKTNLAWVTPKPKDGKGETFADDLRAAKVSSALVAETMRRFFLRAKSGEYGTESGKMLTEPSFGFECWMRRFQGIREELEGVTPKTPDIRKTGPPRVNGGPSQRTAANIEAVGDLLRSGGDR